MVALCNSAHHYIFALWFLSFFFSWAGTLYIHFQGLLPLVEFCPVQTSLYVQVLRSPILAALPHGTPAAEWNYGTFTEGTPIFGWAAITLGIGPRSSLTSFA